MTEIEDEFNITEFHLNGNFTLKEDFADTGAVKLSYEAYKKWEAKNAPEILPIGLGDYTSDQLFWISHAQTFCVAERPKRSQSRVETEVYSLERFRINGPLSNSNYFAKTFSCGKGSKMVKAEAEKCLLW